MPPIPSIFLQISTDNHSWVGSSYLVKFDKPIKTIPQIEVKASDLMKL